MAVTDVVYGYMPTQEQITIFAEPLDLKCSSAGHLGRLRLKKWLKRNYPTLNAAIVWYPRGVPRSQTGSRLFFSTRMDHRVPHDHQSAENEIDRTALRNITALDPRLEQLLQGALFTAIPDPHKLRRLPGEELLPPTPEKRAQLAEVSSLP